jgi:quercetin dioxygenase-like cupin family protein
MGLRALNPNGRQANRETTMQAGVQRTGEGRSVWVVGDRYTFLATGEDTGGAYAMIHAVVPPGSGPPPHIHRREDETFYILEGELTCQVDGRTIEAAAGTFVTLPKGSLHSFKNTGTTTAKMLITVNPSGLEQYFAEVGYPSKEESVSPDAIEKLLAVAPKYGLEIQVPK